MYSGDSKGGKFPPVAFLLPDLMNPGSTEPDGSFSPAGRCIYPEYLTDPSIFLVTPECARIFDTGSFLL